MINPITTFWLEKNANAKNIAKMLAAAGGGAAASAGGLHAAGQNPGALKNLFSNNDEGMDRILESLDDLKDTATESGEQIGESLSGVGEDVGSALKELVEQGKPQVNEYLDAIKEQLYGGRSGGARLRDLSGKNTEYRAALRLQQGLRVPDAMFDR
jgi:hypothetical protein